MATRCSVCESTVEPVHAEGMCFGCWHNYTELSAVFASFDPTTRSGNTPYEDFDIDEDVEVTNAINRLANS